ncbi:hypothetical protein Hanom_Chr13g01198701 [Helianthus anomalus]
MVLSSIPDPPGFYRLCIVVPSGGCRVGFSPELVAWWARGSVRAGWAAAGYLSANGCRVRSTRRFLCWTFKKKKKKSKRLQLGIWGEIWLHGKLGNCDI